MNEFIQIARAGAHRWYWYAFTIMAVVLAYSLGQWPLIYVLNQVTADPSLQPDTAAFVEALNFAGLGIPSWVGLVLLLGSPICAVCALLICIKYVHKRKVLTSITSRPRLDWRRIWFAFVIWFGLNAVIDLVMFMVTPGAYTFSFDMTAWIPLLLVSVFLVPIQTTFEEILARGYVLQGVGIVTGSSWYAVGISSLFFAALHLGNPEIHEFGFAIMVVYYLSVAIFLALITLMDSGLEFALGIHAATNIYGAAFVGFKGSVFQTDTLFKVSNVSAEWMLVGFYASMVIFFVVAKLRFDLPSLAITTTTHADGYGHHESEINER